MKMVAGIPITEYNRIHQWARRTLTKTGKCSECFMERRTHWSNKDHKFRLVPEDWQELCPSCHKLYDKYTLGIYIGGPARSPHKLLLEALKEELKDTPIKWDKLSYVELRLKTYPWSKR